MTDPHSTQETMRVYPVPGDIQRVLVEHTVLPLATLIVDLSGKVYEELPIPAGTLIGVSVLGYILYVVFSAHIPVGMIGT
jgi:hypothetical protein